VTKFAKLGLAGQCQSGKDKQAAAYS